MAGQVKPESADLDDREADRCGDSGPGAILVSGGRLSVRAMPCWLSVILVLLSKYF
jgi:hypothetical protein